ncbi:hypothetical protein GGI07_001025 [Coemansia sp. Benny D115]|nr:hypothetical protein GGI07_001025 [Coemansia sp. Benny D115]
MSNHFACMTPPTLSPSGSAAALPTNRSMPVDWRLSVRREKRRRVAAILEGRTATPDGTAGASDGPASLSAKELARAMRVRARDVGLMYGVRTRTKPARLSPLADGLRRTLLDEDALVSAALHKEELQGPLPPGDFEAAQEIVALRQAFRHLLRMRMEHPDPATRNNIADLLARASSEKKNLRVPQPQPMCIGPSFFFPATRFTLDSHNPSAREQAAEDEGFSSSSDDSSDGEDDAPMFQNISRGRRPQTTHAGWAQSYGNALRAQWPSGAPRLLQLLTPLPQSGQALLDTLGTVFRLGRSGLREAQAHYLFGVAAAQVGSLPLVCMAEARVVDACFSEGDRHGDTHEATLAKGLGAACPRTRLLAQYAQMLEQQPWAITGGDVAAIVQALVSLQHAESNGRPVPDHGRRHAEAAVRDLLHATVLAAVGHGLGVLAGSCGLAPDLDQCAGTYFANLDKLVAIVPSPGLEFPQVALPDAPFSASPMQRLPASFVETVERNTAEFIARIENNGSTDTASSHRASSQPQRSLHIPPPPASVLRAFAGADARVNGYYRALSHAVDPLSNTLPQFVAYRQIRAQKLAQYHQPEIPLQKIDMLHHTTLSSSQKPPTSVHLSQREDLRWDVISDYLRQQLSAGKDTLGLEVLVARTQPVRRVLEHALDAPVDPSAGSVYFYEKNNSPILPPSANRIPWASNSETDTPDRMADMEPKSYSQSRVLQMADITPHVATRSIDVRQFHDAVWHYTMSLFHIYEEYYFYSKFRAESSEVDVDMDGAISVPYSFDSGSTPGMDQNSVQSPQYQKWLTDELKSHIRQAVRKPMDITALDAQPPVATGLNLCVEEMVHINLIVSLAKRQAEIIHGVRAIREYEQNMSNVF